MPLPRRVVLLLRAAPLSASLVAACGGSSGSSVSRPTPASTSAVVVEGRGDLDGRAGDEALTLYADGTIAAGGLVGKVEPQETSEYFRAEQGRLSVEQLDGATRVVLLALPTGDPEDPPNRYRVLVPRGDRLVPIFDEVIGVYGVTELRFPGDGTVRYTQDSWTACQAAQGESATMPEEPVPVHEVVLALEGDRLVERERTPTGEDFDCNDLAACPWVYVDGAGGPVRVGEILRDLRGRDAYALQDLALPSAAAGPLRVRIAEEEDEVTFLDEVYVEVDGVRVAPAACAVAAAPAYCDADHRPLRLEKGDVLELTFELPAAAAPVVFARGYYVPTPSRARR